MPRNDGHNPEHPRRHHKAMNSARNGSGLDKKIRKRKRLAGDYRSLCPICGCPTVDASRHKRRAHTKVR